MADFEGDKPNFDELEELSALGDEAAADELAAGDEAAEQLETAEGLEAVDEEKAADDQAAETEESEEEAAEKPRKKSFLAEAAAAIGIPVAFAGLFLANMLFLSTAIFLALMCFIPLGIWMGRRSNTVFTVCLGCTLAALFTACFCLWVELRRYSFDIKAKEARVSMVQPIGTESLAWHTLPIDRLDG